PLEHLTGGVVTQPLVGSSTAVPCWLSATNVTVNLIGGSSAWAYSVLSPSVSSRDKQARAGGVKAKILRFMVGDPPRRNYSRGPVRARESGGSRRSLQSDYPLRRREFIPLKDYHVNMKVAEIAGKCRVARALIVPGVGNVIRDGAHAA